LRARWVRRFFGFTPDDLKDLLQKLGIRSGDVLLVHSSFNRFEGFTGNALDVIRVLREAVGPKGTLLMPTMTFGYRAVDNAREGKFFDVRRTPSRMGVISELFRRSPGVVRSVHPTHSVAAWGARALVADHHEVGTPCGPGTPWARLLEHRGKILFLGTGIITMTFYHACEEILAPRMPFSLDAGDLRHAQQG
jgi:aminoglycoside 3-N-acetyltransferase